MTRLLDGLLRFREQQCIDWHGSLEFVGEQWPVLVPPTVRSSLCGCEASNNSQDANAFRDGNGSTVGVIEKVGISRASFVDFPDGGEYLICRKNVIALLGAQMVLRRRQSLNLLPVEAATDRFED